jgi:uncharacterized protein YacL
MSNIIGSLWPEPSSARDPIWRKFQGIWAQLWSEQPWMGAFFGLVLGLIVVLIDKLLKGVSLRAFSSATFGLTLGCVLATLVWSSHIFDYATTDAQWMIRLGIYLTFGYLGTMLALRSNRDEFSLLIPYIRFIGQQPHEQVNLLDTSSIIDGKIGELSKTGFIDGTLVVPRFVLDELQALADCPDQTKRARGRRGLDLLTDLQKSHVIEVKIHDAPSDKEPVDSKLIHLGRVLNARLITTDYNLSRVAELQKVRVLNLHQLANVLKTSLAVGEMVSLKLVKDGKEPHQAVGYLPDGTMIVVNHARQMIGQEVDVTVTGSHQTNAGRMIFADISRPYKVLRAD